MTLRRPADSPLHHAAEFQTDLADVRWRHARRSPTPRASPLPTARRPAGPISFSGSVRSRSKNTSETEPLFAAVWPSCQIDTPTDSSAQGLRWRHPRASGLHHTKQQINITRERPVFTKRSSKSTSASTRGSDDTCVVLAPKARATDQRTPTAERDRPIILFADGDVRSSCPRPLTSVTLGFQHAAA